MNIRIYNATAAACASAAAFLLSACQGELAIVDDLVNADANLATSTSAGGPCGCTNTNSLMALGCGQGEVELLQNDIIQTTTDGSVVAFTVTSPTIPYRLVYWDGGLTSRDLGAGFLLGLTAAGDRMLIAKDGVPALIDLSGNLTAVALDDIPLGHGSLSAAGDSVVGSTYGDTVNLARLNTGTNSVELLGEVGGPGAEINDVYVNPAGTAIVGTAFGTPEGSGGTAFRWTQAQGLVFGLDGAPTGASVMPEALSADGSVVAGRTLDQEVHFRWTEAQGYQVIASASNRSATWLSADGNVALGTLVPASGHDSSAFRWTAATGPLEIMPATSNIAIDISDDGNVIVAQSWEDEQFDGAPPEQTFVWDASNGTRTLEQLLQERGVTAEGWEFFQPRVLSGDGKVLVGRGTCGGVPTLYRVVLSG